MKTVRNRPEPFLHAAALLLVLASASACPALSEVPESATPLGLREALALGIERNLDLRLQETVIPLRQEEVVVRDAEFDPLLEARVDTREDKVPSAAASPAEDAERLHTAGADTGIRKRFTSGLESRLAVETLRLSGNSSSVGLDPQYRSLLVLDLSQPLLKDRGEEVNTADLRVGRNEVLQARYRYLDRALRIGEEIELAYYDVAAARQLLAYRVEALRRAEDLLAGNREKFAAGVVPVTEVQQAETAVAARDEQVVVARQLLELLSTRLRDLLEIRWGDPRYGASFLTEPLPAAPEEYPELGEALAVALAERPDVRERLLDVENRDIRLAFARNQVLPRLDLVATLGLNGLSGDEREGVASQYQGNYFDSFSNLPNGDGYQWQAGLLFTYPLGNRAAEARLRQSGWEKRQAVYAVKRLEGTAETEVERAFVDVRRSLERYRVAERFEALAETTLQQETERLKGGLSDTFRVLSFQDDLTEARIRKDAALAGCQKGLASLYRAIGKNLERHGIVAELREEGIDRGSL
jgi:outer membrane protein TolC